MAKDKLTKSDLVNKIAADTGLSKVSVERTMASLQENIIQAVVDGKSVTLSNFVSFTPSVRNGRDEWVNPRNKKVMKVKEKTIVKAKPLKAFLDRVAGFKK